MDILGGILFIIIYFGMWSIPIIQISALLVDHTNKFETDYSLRFMSLLTGVKTEKGINYWKE